MRKRNDPEFVGIAWATRYLGTSARTIRDAAIYYGFAHREPGEPWKFETAKLRRLEKLIRKERTFLLLVPDGYWTLPGAQIRTGMSRIQLLSLIARGTISHRLDRGHYFVSQTELENLIKFRAQTGLNGKPPSDDELSVLETAQKLEVHIVYVHDLARANALTRICRNYTWFKKDEVELVKAVRAFLKKTLGPRHGTPEEVAQFRARLSQDPSLMSALKLPST